jgi:two-component system, NtrC family, response regulator HydG
MYAARRMAAPPDDYDDRSTTLHAKFDPSPGAEAAYEVVVIEGPDAGRTLLVDGSLPSRVLVGQSPSCALRLSDPLVSRRHIALDLSGRRMRITDLGSKNGTIVDGVALLDGYLRGGEVVRLGSSALRVDVRGETAVEPLVAEPGFGLVIGISAEMRRLYPLCQRLAATDVTVIIEGETGTGKEVLAESLHLASPRAAGPFVIFDCTAVPANLLEAELFGHERGAFTGAVATRQGALEQANGGTLLIDEIGELDLALQPKLLRAISRCEVRRVGGNRAQRVDVRILAATRRDLDREVQAGRFRDDLFHRLAVARIELPPLRERRGDVPVLAAHFCQELGGEAASLPPELLLRWAELPWPGNVRELRNLVARHLALGELAQVAPSHRPQALRQVDDALLGAAAGADDWIEHALRLPLSEARQRVVDEFERRYLEGALARHGGNVTRAAEAAGVARRHFQTLKARRLTR